MVADGSPWWAWRLSHDAVWCLLAVRARRGLLGCHQQCRRMGPAQVDVVDEAGRPVNGAVAFLESGRQCLDSSLAGPRWRSKASSFCRGTGGAGGHFRAFPEPRQRATMCTSFSPAKKFELKLYTGTPANPVVFERAGVVTLGCKHPRPHGGLDCGGGHAVLRAGLPRAPHRCRSTACRTANQGCASGTPHGTGRCRP